MNANSTMRPNILFIIADDHRSEAIHAVGDKVVQTPNLDGLVARGVCFRQHHSMGGMLGGVCVPSRAAIHTGANPFRASVRPRVNDAEGSRTLNPTLPTLPAVLRGAGYHTYATGKWHNDKASFNAGFVDGANLFFGGMSDHWRVPLHAYDPSGAYLPEARTIGGKHSTECFSDAAVQFLQAYNGERPFFLYVAFTAPHDPRTAPPEYAARYDPAALPLPENYLPQHPFDNGDLRTRDERLAPWPRTAEIVRQHLADYYAMISHLDSGVGRILAALQSRADGVNSVVVYSADHGLAVGQHGLMGKQNLYEHSVHIPLLLSGPDLPAGRQIDALTLQYDLFPTLCALTDTPAPATLEGANLLPLVSGERRRVHDSIFSVYKDVQRMVSDGAWKLIRYYHSRAFATGTDCLQLFELTVDPWETHDRSGDRAAQRHLHRLAAELASWQRRLNDPLAGIPVLRA